MKCCSGSARQRRAVWCGYDGGWSRVRGLVRRRAMPDVEAAGEAVCGP